MNPRAQKATACVVLALLLIIGLLSWQPHHTTRPEPARVRLELGLSATISISGPVSFRAEQPGLSVPPQTRDPSLEWLRLRSLKTMNQQDGFILKIPAPIPMSRGL